MDSFTLVRMQHEYPVRNLNVPGFTQQSAHAGGSATLGEFPRLLDEAVPSPAIAAQTVRFSARGRMQLDAAGKPEPWLSVSGEVEIPMVCQRCLSPVDVSVRFARDFRFVASEALAAVEDEESEEDVLVLSRNFDLLELVEDELIMAVPPAPTHVVCPRPVRLQAQDADFEAAPPPKAHPFSVLARLKKDAED